MANSSLLVVRAGYSAGVLIANDSSEPTLLRYGFAMAGTACHCKTSTTHRGSTQVLGGMGSRRWLVALQFVPLIVIAAALTFWAEAPYIVTAAVILTLATVGHLVSLEEDYPGNWSNPDADPRHWRLSLLELGLKAAAVVLIFWLMLEYPSLKSYGWR
jgi:hypothetical protein